MNIENCVFGGIQFPSSYYEDFCSLFASLVKEDSQNLAVMDARTEYPSLEELFPLPENTKEILFLDYLGEKHCKEMITNPNSWKKHQGLYDVLRKEKPTLTVILSVGEPLKEYTYELRFDEDEKGQLIVCMELCQTKEIPL